MSQTLRCANHPNVETFLRCNRCGKPICTKCAVRTPVGYRCKECVRAQQALFYSDFRPVHYLVALAVALPLALVAGWLLPRLGWFTLILGPIAGSAIAQAARWATRRRRGRYVWLVVCASVVVGALPTLLLWLIGAALDFSLGRLLDLLWWAVYLASAVGSAYAWLRPGRRV